MASVVHGGRRGAFRLAASVLALAGLLAACGSKSSSSSNSSTTTSAGTGSSVTDLVIARDIDITTLDPHRMWCDTCMIVLSGAYERLVRVDAAHPDKPQPELATSWTVNAENTEFTFKLNPAAKFADGTPVTSADVKWTYERSANMNGGASFLLAGLDSVDTPDPLTAVVKFKTPNSPFIQISGAALGLSIVNSKAAIAEAKALSGVGADKDTADGWFTGGHSLGSGPYEIESYTPKQSIKLKRNESYWGAKAKFASITIKQVADSASQLLQLKNGDVDVAMNVSFDSLSEVNSDAKLVASAVDSFNIIYLTLQPLAPGGADLADVRVRQAIASAIDYDGLIKATLAGNGKPQAAAIPNGFAGTENLPPPKYDLAKAQALMKAAGKEAGFSVEAEYIKINIYGVDSDVLMQKIQQDLKKININITLKPVDWPRWLADTQSTGLPFSWVYFAPDFLDASEYVKYMGPITGGARGYPSFPASFKPEPNKEADDLYNKGLQVSGAEQAAIWAKLGQIMIDNAEVVGLINPKTLFVARKEITGLVLSGCCVLDLRDLGTE